MSRRNRSLRSFRGARSCSTMGRLPRGVIGFVVGSLIGGAAVFAIQMVNVQSVVDGKAPSFELLGVAGLVGMTCTIGGTYIAARKPTC